MNIRDWPSDQIMALPDHCFGRRFVVAVAAQSISENIGWEISDLALPEWCVLWEIAFWTPDPAGDISNFQIALGDQIPTSAAMMDALDPLIPGWGIHRPDPQYIQLPYLGGFARMTMRYPIHSGGRRLVLAVDGTTTKVPVVFFQGIFSSMPTEVPDWLVSGYPRNR